MTSSSTYEAVFDYLFNSVARQQERENEFFKAFLASFPKLSSEQASLKNSSRGESNGQIITTSRFKDFSIRLVFSTSELLEAEMKLSKTAFNDLKQYAKGKYSGTPSLTWEKEMFGMMETLKAHHFNTEANFPEVFGMSPEVTIKHSS